MSNDVANLVLRVDSLEVKLADKDLKNLNKTSKNTDKATASMTRGFGSMARSLGAFGAVLSSVGLSVSIGSITSATIEQEKAINQLEQRLKSTSGVVGASSEALQNFAAQLQGVTTYGDEAILSMQGILLTFTRIRGEAFDRTTKAVLDLSTAMGTDLKSSAIQLGKALNDPAKNLFALSRSGIQFSKDQIDLIKSLQETNQIAKAQDIILKELSVQFGGAAIAARDTFGGALKSLRNAFGDLMESKGGLDEVKSALESLTKTLSKPETIAAFNTFTAGIFQALNSVIKFTTAMSNLDKVFSTIKYEANIKRLNGLSESLKYYLELSDDAFESNDLDKFNEYQEKINELQVAYDRTSESLKDYDKEVEDYGKTISGINKLEVPRLELLKGTSDATSSLNGSTGTLKGSISALTAEYDDMDRAIDLIIAQFDELDKAEARNIAGLQDVAKETKIATKETIELTKEADPFYTAWENAFTRLDTAGSDFWSNLFSGAENSLDGIQNLLESWLAEMAHSLITKPLTMSFQGSVLGTGGAGGVGMTSGGGSSLSGVLGSASDINSATSLFSSGSQFFSTAADWGIGSALGSVGAATAFGAAGAGVSQAAMLASQTAAFGAAGTSATVGALGGATMGGVASAAMTAIPYVGIAIAIASALGMFDSDSDVTPDLNISAQKRTNFGIGSDPVDLFDMGAEENGSFDPHASVSGQFAAFNFSTKHDAFSSEADAQAFVDGVANRYLTLENVIFESLGEELSESVHDAMSGFSTGRIKFEDFSGPDQMEQLFQTIFGEIFKGLGNVDDDASKYAQVYKDALTTYGSVDLAVAKFASLKGVMDSGDSDRSFDNVSNMMDAFASGVEGVEDQLYELSAITQLISLESVSDDFKKFMLDVDDIVSAGFAGTMESVSYDFAGKQNELDALRSKLEESESKDSSLSGLFDGMSSVSSVTKDLIQQIESLEYEMENLSGSTFVLSHELEYTASELLMLGQNLATVNSVLDITNQSAFDFTLSGAKLAESLIAGAGGLESFLSKMDYFYNNFYTDQERMQNVLDSTNKVITEFNDKYETSIFSKDSLREIMEGLDLTTESGQEFYNSLLNLAPTMDQNTDALQYFQDQTDSAAEASRIAADAIARAAIESAEASRMMAEEASLAAQILRDELVGAMTDINQMISSSAEQWQLDTFSDQEKSDYFSQRADADFVALQNATSVEDITALTESIIGYGDKMWALLDDVGKQENLDQFLQSAEDVEFSASQRLDLTGQEMESINFKSIEISSQQSADAAESFKLASESIRLAAEIIRDAANTSLTAANTEKKIDVSIETISSEVG